MRTALITLLSLSTAGTGYSITTDAPANGISDVRYEVTFDEETAARGEIHVEMSFDVMNTEPVLLSLPAWTPGSYQMDDYAQNVRNATARQGSADVDWDKADYDTWRIHPTGTGRVTFAFDYFADALDVGSSWAASDFAFFNGTNVFPFPEDQSLDFDADVVFHTEADWGVATGMDAGDGARTYTAADYHTLVDMPTLIGRFDADSAMIGGKWYHLATYPAGVLSGEPRTLLWEQIEQMMPPMEEVFDVVPWEDYTTLLVFDPSFAGGSALEHASSHLGVYHPQFIGSPILASITAHEIFHAWNVKRLRPADLWPYVYGEEMPTELLWISEGITDYYADLALVRGGIVGPETFYQLTQGKIDEVAATVPVALEDASLSAWIQPRDGTGSLYYPKGSLAGFMLDVLIRDASDNARSLDDVMKAMYERAYQNGRGFTEEEWWAAVRDAAGGRSFEDFHDRYVDGREPYPWDEILPLAGLVLSRDTTTVPRIGITTTGDEEGVRVVDVIAGGAGAAAGVRIGDLLVRIGGIEVEDAFYGVIFRERFEGRPAGEPYEIVVDRDGELLTLNAELAYADITTATLVEDPDAGDEARRVREGILTGAVGR